MLNASGRQTGCVIASLLTMLPVYFTTPAQQPQPSGFKLPQAVDRQLPDSVTKAQTAVLRGTALTVPDTVRLRVEMVPKPKPDRMPLIATLLTSLAGIFVTGSIARRQIGQKDAEIANLNSQKSAEWKRQDLQLSTALNRQLDEEERQRTAEQLNKFYQPIARQLAVSGLLHAQLMKAKPGRDQSNFRTLMAILEGYKFDETESALVDEIVETTSRIRKEILAGGAAVTDPNLAGLLARAAFHFRVLELARKGLLRVPPGGDTEAFRDAVYPRELNAALDATIKVLESRLIELQRRPDEIGSVGSGTTA